MRATKKKSPKCPQETDKAGPTWGKQSWTGFYPTCKEFTEGGSTEKPRAHILTPNRSLFKTWFFPLEYVNCIDYQVQ